jgi:hypothetical protein
MRKKKKVPFEKKLVDESVEFLNPWFERLDTFLGKSSDSIDSFFSQEDKKSSKSKSKNNNK